MSFIINGFADVFEMAVKKLKIAENYSDVNTDTDVNNAKSQRRIMAKKKYDSDSSTESWSQLNHPVKVSSSKGLKYPNPPKPIGMNNNINCIYQLVMILLIATLKYIVIFALVKHFNLYNYDNLLNSYVSASSSTFKKKTSDQKMKCKSFFY